MAWTSHAKNIPGTSLDYDEMPMVMSSCAGPGKCDTCDNDIAQFQMNEEVDPYIWE